MSTWVGTRPTDSVQPEYVVNFAAQSEVGPSWEFPDQWFQTNVVAITQLINALKDKKYLKRYVHISSPEVYGTCVGVVREDTPMNPSTPYAASKAAGDFSIYTYRARFAQHGFKWKRDVKIIGNPFWKMPLLDLLYGHPEGGIQRLRRLQTFFHMEFHIF